MNIGDSPSGKAMDSDSIIRVFESLIPSHEKAHFWVRFFRYWIRVRVPVLAGVRARSEKGGENV